MHVNREGGLTLRGVEDEEESTKETEKERLRRQEENQDRWYPTSHMLQDSSHQFCETWQSNVKN